MSSWRFLSLKVVPSLVCVEASFFPVSLGWRGTAGLSGKGLSSMGVVSLWSLSSDVVLVWEILQDKWVTAETHKGLKRVTRVQCSWIFTFTIFGKLSDRYPFSTKWLPRDHHAGVLRQEFCISGLKIHRWKTKNVKRKFKRMLSFLFVEEGKLFIKKSPLEEFNLAFFTTDLWSALKWNQGSEVFAEFSGTFCTLWPRQLRFWKGIYVFLNVA